MELAFFTPALKQNYHYLVFIKCFIVFFVFCDFLKNSLQVSTENVDLSWHINIETK